MTDEPQGPAPTPQDGAATAQGGAPNPHEEPTPKGGAPNPHEGPTPKGGAPTPQPGTPTYKGEPLDAERGPGLGCFWLQVVVLGVLLVLTPLSVVWLAPSWLSATLLIASLVVLFFVGQTTIFLLRLVAADRRSRRHPLSDSARRTVGQLEDEGSKLDEASRSDQDDPGAG